MSFSPESQAVREGKRPLFSLSPEGGAQGKGRAAQTCAVMRGCRLCSAPMESMYGGKLDRFINCTKLSVSKRWAGRRKSSMLVQVGRKWPFLVL